jgi:hypothetical protein
MKRIHLITLLTAGMLLSSVPAAGAQSDAASVTKSAGSVSATVSWRTDGEFGAARQPRLRVSRAGVVVTDISVASACRGCALVEDSASDGEPFSIMHVADLDADGEPEVLFDVHSGGAHCCVTTRLFTYRPESSTYARAPSQLGQRALCGRRPRRRRAPRALRRRR